MIGPRYWSTGIALKYHEPYNQHGPAWSGSVDYFDDGFADDLAAEDRISTNGTVRTRYGVEGERALPAVIDALIRDAAKLGIEFMLCKLYWDGEGESPPEQLLEALVAQCERIGWQHGFLVDTADKNVA